MGPSTNKGMPRREACEVGGEPGEDSGCCSQTWPLGRWAPVVAAAHPAGGQCVTWKWISGWRVWHLLLPLNAETLPAVSPTEKNSMQGPHHGSSSLDWFSQSAEPVSGPGHACSPPGLQSKLWFERDRFPHGGRFGEEWQFCFQCSRTLQLCYLLGPLLWVKGLALKKCDPGRCES